jgi:IclR family transcriptional regulator, KDG regulon repressor
VTEATKSGVAGPRRGAQSVYRAIDILEAFLVDSPSLSLAEISEAVHLKVPTTHRLLKALQAKDLIVVDPNSRKYSLGGGVMRLANVIISRDDIAAISQPGLVKLRNETGETVALHCLVGDQRVCLVELSSSQPIRMASGVGRAYPLFAGAAGKAILAFLPPDRVDRIIKASKSAPSGAPSAPRTLLTQLPEIRARGYAISSGETVKGAAALAAAILDSEDRVVGAINVTGPADRFTSAKVKKAVKPLLRVTDEIMRQLGRVGPQTDGRRISRSD